MSSYYQPLSAFPPNKIIVDIYPANHVFTAHPVFAPDENWFLALRHGEYSMQVDKAVSEILRLYMPQYTPEVLQVNQGDDFYVATKEIPNVIDNLPSNPNPINFGKTSVIAYFVGESDIHSGNMLWSQDATNVYAHKIDHAESLNVEKLGEPITLNDVLDNHWNLPSVLTEHENYKNEQICMILEIAKTPIDSFARILEENITTTQKDEVFLFASKLLKSDLLDEASIDDLKALIEQEKDSYQGAIMHDLIPLIYTRHEAFKAIASELPTTHIPTACASLIHEETGLGSAQPIFG